MEMVKKEKEVKDSKFTMKSKVQMKNIIKGNKMEVHIKSIKPESPWEEENRFFKGNFNKEKRSMFFS